MELNKRASKEYLYQAYVINRKASTEIAKDLKVSYATVLRWLRSYGIKIENIRVTNLVGREFGRLTVVSWSHRAKRQNYWRCQCKCKKYTIVSSVCLTSSNTQSCGCLKIDKTKEKLIKNLKGIKFGKLTVLEQSERKNSYRKIIWICQCDCGNIIHVLGSNLLKGNSTQCRDCSVKKGVESPNWNHNISEEERVDRRKIEGYRLWHINVLEANDFRCQKCKIRGGTLCAHHKDGWHWCHAKRLSVENGACLCLACHSLFHKIYGFKHNTELQFMDFINEQKI